MERFKYPAHASRHYINKLKKFLTAKDVRSDLWLISPDMAEIMLCHNFPGEENRRLRPGVVGKYADSMKSGHWRVTPQAIAFDKRGVLIDGQHRLEAIKLSGETIKATVSAGYCEEAFGALDQGAKRGLGDAFELLGVKNPIAASAIVPIIYQYEQGGIAAYGTWLKANARRQPMHRDYVEYMRDNIDADLLNEALNMAGKARRHRPPLNKSNKVLADLYYILVRIGYDRAEVHDYFDHLITTDGLRAKHPLQQAHNALIAMLAGNERKAQRTDNYVRAGIILTAVQQMLAGKRSVGQNRFDETMDLPKVI